jgi:isocitrate dehydrogenase
LISVSIGYDSRENVAFHVAANRKPRVVDFAKTLERVCIETVESGFMTKDLALLVSPDQGWMTTLEFLDKLDSNLRDRVG